jgi:hypothetical protein
MRCLVWKLGANVDNTPLINAALQGNPAVVRLLVELGADVNHADPSDDGRTPLIIAACFGDLAIVRCLIELGAEVGAVNVLGNTALLESTFNGRLSMTQYFLENADANMDTVNNDGETLWDMLKGHLEDVADEASVLEEDATAELTGLLRVMVLRGAPTPALVALLSPEHARVVQEGARLRARLPAYLAHRRAYLDLRCPRISLLPGVLRALIYTFEGRATTEGLWATGLGQAN